MATKKISELEAITKAEDDDLLVIVDNSEEATKKIEKKYFLSELNGIIEELQEDLKDTEENQLTAPASGESIDLNDSAKAKIREPKLTGKSWQNSTTGKNLASLETSQEKVIGGVPFSIEEGIIKINGTLNVNQNFYFDSFRTNNDDAVFSVEVTGYTDRDSQNASIILQESTDNETFTTLAEITLKSTTTKTKSIVLDSSKYYRVRMYAYNGNTFTNATIKVQLEYGTSKTAWEKYTNGASPNPDYTQDIHRTGDNVNLFDEDTVTFITGILDDNGNPTGSTSSHYTNNFYQVQPNTDYTLSGTLQYGSGASRIYFYDQNKQWISRTEGTQKNSAIFRTPTNCYFIKIQTLIDITLKTGDVKLEKGTKSTPWSPYGCGNINEKVQNKNIWQDNEVLSMNKISFSNGIYSASDNDNRSSLRYKIQEYAGSTVIPDPYQTYKDITALGKYYFILTKATNADRVRIANAGSTSEFSLNYSLDDIEAGEQFTIVLDVIDNTVGASKFKDVMLLKGAITSTDYVAYQEQNISFPLAEGQVLAQDDYIDDDGVHHVRGTVVLDGTENWNYNSSNVVFVVQNLINYKTGNYTPLSTHYIGQMNVTEYRDIIDKRITCLNSSTSNRLIIKDTRYTSNNDFKAYLAEQYANGTPVEVEYDLAEEYVEPFTEEQAEAWEQIKKIKTYKTVTHISSPDETPATMDFVYVRDLQTVIDSLTNAIISLGGNV